MPLFDENGERIRGRQNQSAALQAIAKVKVILADDGPSGFLSGEWIVARVCSDYLQYCEQGHNFRDTLEGCSYMAQRPLCFLRCVASCAAQKGPRDDLDREALDVEEHRNASRRDQRRTRGFQSGGRDVRRDEPTEGSEEACAETERRPRSPRNLQEVGLLTRKMLHSDNSAQKNDLFWESPKGGSQMPLRFSYWVPSATISAFAFEYEISAHSRKLRDAKGIRNHNPFRIVSGTWS